MLSLYKKLLTFFVLILLAGLGYGQQFSSEGKNFYVSYIPSTAQLNCDLTLSSRKNSTVKVENSKMGYSQTYYLTANTPQTVSVPANFCIPKLTDSVTDVAIHITATEPISVYAMSYVAAIADGTLILPEEAVGSEYYTASYDGISNAQSAFIIVAFEDNVRVKIIPSLITRGGHTAGTPYYKNLKKGEVYMEYGTGAKDLSGTYIKEINNKKIAVFSGTQCVNIPVGCQACDVLIEQLMPVNSLGKNFLMAPLSNATVTPKYTYRIIATQDSTKITVDGTYIATINKSASYTVNNQSGDIYITTSKPAMAVQYMQGRSCETIGDPSMVLIPPIDQFTNRVNYTTAGHSGFTEHYVYVLLKTADKAKLKINGSTVSSNIFTSFSNLSSYSYATIKLNPGSYLVECDNGFMLTAYGYGLYISYAYIGGADFRNLNFDFKSKATCNTRTVQFTTIGEDTSAIINNYWDFGDGTADSGLKVTKTYSKEGEYIVKNTINVGGNIPYTVVSSKIVRTLSNPNTGFYIDTISDCLLNNRFLLSDTSTFPNKSSKLQSIWTFSDTSLKYTNLPSKSYVFKKEGTYTAKLKIISTDSCVDSTIKTIIVKPSAIAAFSRVDSQCYNQHKFEPIQLSSIVAPETIIGYNWDFGDNTNSSAASPIKYYSDSGHYNITMAAIASNGCNDTIKKTFTIFPVPKIEFSTSSNCLGLQTQFVNTSKIPPGYNKYLWSFDDNTTDTNWQAIKTYADSGLKTIQLKITTQWGCSDSLSKNMRTFPLPKADFFTNIICANNGLQIADITKRYNIPVQENIWDIDGMAISNTGSVNYTFTTPGIKKIKLHTIDINSCVDSVEKLVMVNEVPKVSFTINTPIQCIKNNNFIFTSNSTINNGKINTQNWYLNNMPALQGSAIMNKIFSQPGDVSVKLIVVSDSGCMDSAINKVTINPNITVKVALNDSFQCFNNHNFVFTNNSSINGTGNIAKYTWNFSDNTNPVNNGGVIHKKFTADGIYYATCYMETDQGCADTFTHTLILKPNPDVNFSANEICFGDSVLFDNVTVSNPANPITYWLWDFGNGKKSNKKSPYHKYNATGNYLVSLEANTIDGCKDTLTKYFPDLVKPSPKVYFEEKFIESYEKNSTYSFTNLSDGATSYLWDFGDFTTSYEISPTKIYSIIGYFTIKLTAENTYKCTSSYQKKVYVVPDFDIQIPNAFTPNRGDDLNRIFRIEGVYYTKEYSFQIFDRWGSTIFSTTNPDEGWDGNYKGAAVPEGAYLYYVRILDMKNKLHIKNGTVTLLR